MPSAAGASAAAETWQTARVRARIVVTAVGEAGFAVTAVGAAGIAVIVACGGSTPDARRPTRDESSGPPAATSMAPPAADVEAAPAGLVAAAPGGPAAEASATPSTGERPAAPAACRVETAALTCISRECFGRPDRKPGTGPSGFLPVHIRFDAAGEIAAFEPESDAEVWRGAVACARACVERSARPRACRTSIYLHTK